MLLEIHALMKDADDLYSVVLRPKKQHMRADRKLLIAFADVIAAPPSAGITYDRLNTAVQSSEVTIRLVLAPTVGSIAPYLPQVGSGTR